jgi:biotin synthase
MTKKEIVDYLKSNNSESLFFEADKVRKASVGDDVHIRGIIEFSSFCRRDCLYCGLRKSNNKLVRYRLSLDEIMQSVEKAKLFNYQTIVLQSGEDEYFTTKDLFNLIEKIRKIYNGAITLSVGEKSFKELKELKDAGADRYLLKFETSDKDLYKKLKPDSRYEDRFNCLDDLKSCGFQVGSGIMVGLPGQTFEILAEDLLTFKKYDFDMIGIGPFIAHPNTPLAEDLSGTLELTLKVVALTRILSPRSHMPATTAIGTIDLVGRQKALKCGANVIMPNLTPQKYRKLYEIYPDKICINEDADNCQACVKNLVESVERSIAKTRGDAF